MRREKFFIEEHRDLSATEVDLIKWILVRQEGDFRHNRVEKLLSFETLPTGDDADQRKVRMIP